MHTIDEAEVLANVFRLADGDPGRLEPTEVMFDLTRWEGLIVRLRVVQVATWTQMLSGVDNVRIEPIGQPDCGPATASEN